MNRIEILEPLEGQTIELIKRLQVTLDVSEQLVIAQTLKILCEIIYPR